MELSDMIGAHKLPAEVFAKRSCWNSGEQKGLCINIYTLEYFKYGDTTGRRASPVTAGRGDYVFCTKDGEELKQQNKEIKMVDKNYIGGDYEVVECVYGMESTLQGAKYSFKIDKDLVSAISIDDMVVVDSQSGYGLCKVVKIVDNNIHNANIIKKATEWVVDRVDQTMHNKRIQATERREYILQQLEEKKQQLEAVAVYEMLAKSDPATAKLVEELKSLGLNQ